jgi:hypothetical protein
MPEITVTESQQEQLDAVRTDLEAAYIDTYGHIRTTDVLQYLLDTYTPPEQQSDVAHEQIATAEFPRLQQVAAEVEGVPGSGIDTETMRGELLSTLGVEEFASRLAALDPPEDADTGADESDPEGDDAEAATETEAEPADGSADEDDTSGADGDEPAEAAPDAGGPAQGGDSDAILSAANQLLNNHDDKWRKGSGEEPYEVDLPDGSTADVRTRDDVKQLLFKHY